MSCTCPSWRNQSLGIVALLLSLATFRLAAAQARTDEPPPSQPAKVVVKKDVVYGNVQGAGLLADIAYPEGKGRFPVILSVHGGRWVGSSRTDRWSWAATNADACKVILWSLAMRC